MAASPLRALLLALAMVASVTCAAGASPRPASRFVAFRSPSGNIHCMYVSGTGNAALRCDVLQSTAPPPRRPASCEFDYGAFFGLQDRGAATRLCVSDTVADPRNRVLAYGARWTGGRITCTSATTGVRCTNADRHGFTLSRGRQTLF